MFLCPLRVWNSLKHNPVTQKDGCFFAMATTCLCHSVLRPEFIVDISRSKTICPTPGTPNKGRLQMVRHQMEICGQSRESTDSVVSFSQLEIYPVKCKPSGFNIFQPSTHLAWTTWVRCTQWIWLRSVLSGVQDQKSTGHQWDLAGRCWFYRARAANSCQLVRWFFAISLVLPLVSI